MKRLFTFGLALAPFVKGQVAAQLKNTLNGQSWNLSKRADESLAGLSTKSSRTGFLSGYVLKTYSIIWPVLEVMILIKKDLLIIGRP